MFVFESIEIIVADADEHSCAAFRSRHHIEEFFARRFDGIFVAAGFGDLDNRVDEVHIAGADVESFFVEFTGLGELAFFASCIAHCLEDARDECGFEHFAVKDHQLEHFVLVLRGDVFFELGIDECIECFEIASIVAVGLFVGDEGFGVLPLFFVDSA